MILWLEDRQETVKGELDVVLKNSIDFEMHQTIESFDNYLREQSAINPLPVKGFVIDIMLHGVNNLEAVNVKNAPTLAGNMTGFVFVDRYLRAVRSNDYDWSTIPVCFLTERHIDDGLMNDIDYLKGKGQGSVEILRKYKQADADKFLQILRSWGL